MGLSALGNLLETVPQYQQLKKALSRSHARVQAQVIGEAVPFTVATLWKALRVPMLVITARPEEARRLHEQLAAWSGVAESVLHFPETETLPFERLVSDIDTTQERLRTLSKLVGGSVECPVVVASTAAAAQKTLDRDTFVSGSHTLSRGQAIDLDDLLDRWRRMGYRFEPVVEGPGFVSRRGGILDIFPVGSELPARIELWGDEIDSLRLFDPATQLSTEMVDSVTIVPAQETLPTMSDRESAERLMASLDPSDCNTAVQERIAEEFDLLLDGHEVEDLNFYSGFFNRGSLLDYFPAGGVLVLHRPSEISQAAWEADERTHELRHVKEQRGELPYNFPSSHLFWKEVEEQEAGISRRLEIMPWGSDDLTHTEVRVLPFSSPPRFLGNLDRFAEEAEAMAREGHLVVAVSALPKRLVEILEERGVKADVREPLDMHSGAGSIAVPPTTGAGLGEGFVLSIGRRKLAVLSDAEIFGVAKQRRTGRRRTARREELLSELRPGDFVVHVEHGIAKFIGTGRTPMDEGDSEYLILQYASGDKLYVPMGHLDRLASYFAPADRAPTLTRLGTQEWRRTKERVERSTREMASELLSLYAARETVEGHAFGPDVPWLKELEDSFPYQETADQLATMADVKRDMEQSKPMDRLVCGDVGYGKTEIALRAAFKAVMEGRQVAVLVPTTVLAQQHYVTFSQRLSGYPVTIEVLSRFRTDQEQRAVVEGLVSGRVDICIGTHRLIQRDVSFNNLGLVVIDEEQRFGVAHKERLKQMRHEVEVLTLTATPIPRTLNMSLAGIRDMSTIETPPEERLPIKTYVSEFSDELIREAILREIDREGQVFFLHNRVYNIDYMADYVRRMVPEAEVAVGHGQMPESQLEETMIAFAEGKIDVLVCTTIIESGLDIPNVNTLIINRADSIGLAQLYQLRGRVGRGSRRAYAYLLIPTARSLTEAAEKRLKTMLAATELGAGFRIAMKDLEIRGAGNVLGSQQSGHIYAVGFDLYTRLLSEAAEELRAQREAGLSEGAPDATDGQATVATGGVPPEADIATTVDLGIPASIPPEYISDLTTRLDVYRRLAGTDSLEGVESLQSEMVDRFGPLPWQVQNLLYVARLKIRAQQVGVESIRREAERIVLQLRDEVGGARRALGRALGKEVTVGNTQMRLDLGQLSDGWEEALVETVSRLADFRERLAEQVLEAVSR